MNKKVSIMEIQRFSIHDGPGIRTTVFLQGCPLRCLWCANPESHEIGVKLLYLENKCMGCGQCVRVCQYEAISFENGKPVFDREKCTLCRKCGEECVQDAIRFSGEEMTVTDVINIVLRDKEYYDNSGGGVTFSGGEAFFQFEGLMELLRESKKNSLHTAVETCGQYSTDKLKKAMPLIDLFLFDLKHTDQKMLFRFTKGDAKQILSNIKYVANADPDKIILRVPVIPGFNFNENELMNIFNIAVQYKIQNVHLLPYHNLGMSKYEQLGIPYQFETKKSLSKEQLLPFKKLGEERGLHVQIGG